MIDPPLTDTEQATGVVTVELRRGPEAGPRLRLVERLMAPCWCERFADLTPTSDIRAGVTWSCGALNCKPPDESCQTEQPPQS